VIIQHKSNLAGFAGNSVYYWIGQPFINNISHSVSSGVPVFGGGLETVIPASIFFFFFGANSMSSNKQYKNAQAFANVLAVTPHDTNDLTSPADSLYVGATGDVKVDTQGGQTVTITTVPAGAILPIRVTRVYSSGTTATEIFQLWNDVA